MLRRALALTSLAAAVGALAGCGTYGERDEARGTVVSFLSACARDRSTEAYDMLVPAGQKAFIAAGSATAGCGRILRSPAAAADLRTARVASVAVASQHAIAHVDLAGRTAAVPLDLTSEGWRLEGPG